jgi:hypothetical protein
MIMGAELDAPTEECEASAEYIGQLTCHQAQAPYLLLLAR